MATFALLPSNWFLFRGRKAAFPKNNQHLKVGQTAVHTTRWSSVVQGIVI